MASFGNTLRRSSSISSQSPGSRSTAPATQRDELPLRRKRRKRLGIFLLAAHARRKLALALALVALGDRLGGGFDGRGDVHEHARHAHRTGLTIDRAHLHRRF
jgi:hypothetical protein